MTVLLAGSILLAIVASLLMWKAFNRLTRSGIEVDKAWQQVEVELQRRLDLIPNLVETVQGYARHEQTTMIMVVEARAKATQLSDPAAMGAAYEGTRAAVSRLIAVAEHYPELLANQSFLTLQRELETIESRLAFGRRVYNEAVGSFNAAIATFPLLLIAGRLGFRARAFFASTAEAALAPSVQFD